MCALVNYGAAVSKKRSGGRLLASPEGAPRLATIVSLGAMTGGGRLRRPRHVLARRAWRRPEMTAQFRRSMFGLGNTIRSSSGFTVTVAGPHVLIYDDGRGELSIWAEPSVGTARVSVVVSRSAIPDSSDRPRAVVERHLQEAFEFAGWRLRLD